MLGIMTAVLGWKKGQEMPIGTVQNATKLYLIDTKWWRCENPVVHQNVSQKQSNKIAVCNDNGAPWILARSSRQTGPVNKTGHQSLYLSD